MIFDSFWSVFEAKHCAFLVKKVYCIASLFHFQRLEPSNPERLSETVHKLHLKQQIKIIVEISTTQRSIWGQFLTFCFYSRSLSKNRPIRRKTYEPRNLTISLVFLGVSLMKLKNNPKVCTKTHHLKLYVMIVELYGRNLHSEYKFGTW